jgi:hypothetical protein
VPIADQEYEPDWEVTLRRWPAGVAVFVQHSELHDTAEKTTAQ